MLCLCLPLSSCSRYVDSEGKTITNYDKNNPPSDATSVKNYRYALENFSFHEFSSWLFIYCFFWPIPIFLYKYKSKKEKIIQALWCLEPLCAIGSGYYIFYAANILSDPEIGSYLAVTANSIYILAWIAELKTKNRRRKQKFVT